MAEGCRGSIWRRWDPHVHLPGTVLNDQFGDLTVAEALDLLDQASPKIEVVGVTDYLTTASFRAAAAAKAAGSGPGLKLLFPNVELRLDIPTGGGSPVNLHLLCAPDQVENLERLLARIEFPYKGGSYVATRDDLVRLGRDFYNDQSLEEAAALRVGTTQFKVSLEHIRERISSDSWASEHCLVAFAGGQKDGTSGVREADGSFEALREEIERFADIIFSGNPKQRSFWLGLGADDAASIERKYGALKLCLHGSDAHTASKLGQPDLDRRCWLRGDPHFATLEQACLEPANRAQVGSGPPSHDGQRRIDSLIVSSSGWFPSESIPINPSLVAIIGARGSGKTAFADLLAAGANSTQPFENPRSFIRRAGGLIEDDVSAVEWSDGATTTQGLGEPVNSEEFGGEPPVRYLSQQFVDDLCATDGISDRLRKEIERVVFEALPSNQRLAATDFDELLELRLRAPRAIQADELNAIERDTSEITRLRLLRESQASLERDLASLEQQRQQLEQQVRDLTRQVDAALADRFALMTEILQERERVAEAWERRVAAIDALGKAVSSAETLAFPDYLAKLRDKNPGVGLTDEQWSEFLPVFQGDVAAVLTTARESAARAKEIVSGAEADAAPDLALDRMPREELARLSVGKLRAERDRLSRLVGLDEKRSRRLTEVNANLKTLRGRIAKASDAVEGAKEADPLEREAVGSRLLRYTSYFDALLEEQQILTELYQPLASVLGAGGKSLSKLSFAVQRTVDVEEWARAGEEFLDLRTDGPFRGKGALLREARSRLLPAWSQGDGTAAAAAIQAFSAEFSEPLRAHSNVDRSDTASYRDWVAGVSRWLYGADHVSLRYTVEYDGLDIARLSPGTRGVVLLLLYLAVDLTETTPLIIDQPEENLDPESVYTELVALFRAASERRQVIMVTHNANLVVNTDVDQVIVASCGGLETGRLPDLRYESGGLENEAIRQAVCQILEGGEAAFRERARRLRVHRIH